MKKYILFVFCLLAINCKKHETEKPLFLDFYPSISEDEFNKKKKELTEKGVLENGFYNILIEQNKIPFNIYTSNGYTLAKSVSLEYNEVYNEKKQLTNDLKSKFHDNIIGINEYFKNKYPSDVNIINLKDFQTKKTIKNYNYFFENLNIMPENSDFIVFRDTFKTIVLSHSQLRNVKIKNEELSLSIHISYYYNKVFDSILNENINFKIRENEIKLEEENEIIKQSKLKKEIIKKNIENL